MPKILEFDWTIRHRLATFRQSRTLERIGLFPLESYVEADLKWRNMVRNMEGMYPMWNKGLEKRSESVMNPLRSSGPKRPLLHNKSIEGYSDRQCGMLCRYTRQKKRRLVI